MTNIRRELRKIKNQEIGQQQAVILELLSEAKAKYLGLIAKSINNNEVLTEALVDKAKGFLDSKDWKERYCALEAVKDIKNEQVNTMFVQSLNDAYKGILGYAITECGNRKLKESVDLIIQAFEIDDLHVKMNAADALGNIGDKKAVDDLISQFKYYDTSINNSIITSHIAEALGKLKDADAIPVLMKAHQTGEIFMANTEIVNAIGELGAKDYLPTLSKWRASSKLSDERNAIKKIYGTIKEPLVIPYLTSCLEGTYVDWEETVVMLGNTGCIEAASSIINGTVFASFPQSWISNGWVSRIHLSGAMALLKLPQAEVLPMLIMHIKDLTQKKMWLQRSIFYDFCAPFIERISDLDAKPLLESLLEHEKKSIRNAAKKTIDRMNSQ